MSLTLLDWRRRVAALYAAVRAGDLDLAGFRRAKDELFATHPDSPITDEDKATFRGLDYWPERPDLRFQDVEVDHGVEPIELDLQGSRFRRFGRVHLPGLGDLDVYWLETYGGGVFVPFADATSGTTSYGGGRYLLDTVKGADLGGAQGRLTIDFNYAYHPSCVYDPAWDCPLAPHGNRLAVPVEAGERSPTATTS
ncbi:MAG: uncharacterized protein QOF60_2808 [Actinomycetota bacterium]|jgi:uncharacterized protein (DUF1684 family)|nr:uncharacterized protein [Actinomycetota bacterium]